MNLLFRIFAIGLSLLLYLKSRTDDRAKRVVAHKQSDFLNVYGRAGPVLTYWSRAPWPYVRGSN